MNKKLLLYSVLCILIFSACSKLENTLRGCPDAEISWVDVVMINDVKYEGEDEGLSQGKMLDKGEKLGEVDFMLADNACTYHQIENGDAAYLPVGTEIYEVIGYHSDFRVLANDKVYQVSENKQAKVVSDLLDIQGKVEKMSLESDYDQSHITDFTEQETANFIEDLLSLEYQGFEKVNKEIKHDRRAFLRIHLEDGSSFHIVYWVDDNVLSLGAFGTAHMQQIVENNMQ